MGAKATVTNIRERAARRWRKGSAAALASVCGRARQNAHRRRCAHSQHTRGPYVCWLQVCWLMRWLQACWLRCAGCRCAGCRCDGPQVCWLRAHRRRADTPRACVMRVCIPETPQIAHLRTPGAVAQSAAPVARPPDARPTAATEIVWVTERGRAARRVDCQDHGERPRARQSPRRTRAPTTYRRTDAGWGQHRHSGWPRCSVATSAATLLEVAPLFCGVPLSIL